MTLLGRNKTESNCVANFPQTISQTSSLFRQSQHKRKIIDKTRGIVHNCSDLTCTKKYALTEGPKRGGGGDLLSPPPQSFSACYGPVAENTPCPAVKYFVNFPWIISNPCLYGWDLDYFHRSVNFCELVTRYTGIYINRLTVVCETKRSETKPTKTKPNKTKPT